MAKSKPKLYRWEGILWAIKHEGWVDHQYAIPLCPKDTSRLTPVIQTGFDPEYIYQCEYCDSEFEFKKPVKELANILNEKVKYQDAEIINLDGELIPVQREKIKDNDYWAKAKISKNKKGELQLMVLAGSRKTKEKVQLFLDPSNERLAFDQNNDHPTKIFSKVIATFKNSSSTIGSTDLHRNR